jgi:hypothetical protein
MQKHIITDHNRHIYKEANTSVISGRERNEKWNKNRPGLQFTASELSEYEIKS